MTSVLGTRATWAAVSRSCRVAVACVVVLAGSPARAQTEPAPTPPIAQGSTDVPYPAGADGDAAVVLELVVEADGTVSSVNVVDGIDPFAEQARRAAASWRFAPAHRGDTPVAARIHARVEFHRELPPTTAPPP